MIASRVLYFRRNASSRFSSFDVMVDSFFKVRLRPLANGLLRADLSMKVRIDFSVLSPCDEPVLSAANGSNVFLFCCVFAEFWEIRTVIDFDFDERLEDTETC